MARTTTRTAGRISPTPLSERRTRYVTFVSVYLQPLLVSREIWHHWAAAPTGNFFPCLVARTTASASRSSAIDTSPRPGSLS